MKKYLLFFLILCDLEMNACLDSILNNNEDIEFVVIEKKKQGNMIYYVIAMSQKNKELVNLDSLVRNNIDYFNFKGDEFISLKTKDKKLKPNSYIFENNLDGILPYYKMILGFEKYRKEENPILLIEINNKEYKLKI
jgi:hypothetical protein